MRKSKYYGWTKFTEEVLREAARVFRQQMPLSEDDTEGLFLSVHVDDSDWKHDSEEEFFADYRRCGEGSSVYDVSRFPCQLRVYQSSESATIDVGGPTRAQIEAVFAVFEQAADRCRLPPLPELPKPTAPKPVVFIGHGRSPLWRDLKDHLHEKHEYKVCAYEIGARAGHTIRDILEDMLKVSSFALLVMTAEDLMADGGHHPRLNVVHEAGLFQGRLGFNRAIILLEDGADDFSNIQGIEQIRFPAGAIKGTFGDVVATLRREFRDSAPWRD